ncbi:MAG: UbiA family prenyltransferase [Gemmatimonadota bacterium]|nr:UbiA family prenyltransferase [Gemmatimonadota bacterium]
MSVALLPYLRIVRAPAVFSALGDPLAGLLIAGGALTGSRASRLSAAAGLIYLAGMALNDYADRDEDARERPDRPIPSGAISPRTAALMGGSLLLGGVALAQSAGARWSGPALAALVVAYDFPLKHSSVIGPIAMGACRSASLLMGVEAAARGSVWRQGGERALMLGAYVAGLTLIARSETGVARSAELRGGALLVGAALLASVVRGGPRSLPWGALAAALAAPAVVRALRSPGPSTVGSAVGALVRAIPALDGSLAATSAPVPTLVLASLLGLARWGRVLIPIT